MPSDFFKKNKSSPPGRIGQHWETKNSPWEESYRIWVPHFNNYDEVAVSMWFSPLPHWHYGMWETYGSRNKTLFFIQSLFLY